MNEDIKKGYIERIAESSFGNSVIFFGVLFFIGLPLLLSFSESLNTDAVERTPVVIEDEKHFSFSESFLKSSFKRSVPFEITGETSNNAEGIFVMATNNNVVLDEEVLSNFRLGDTTFSYSVNDSAGNYRNGLNTYTFIVLFSDGTKQEIESSFSYYPPVLNSASDSCCKICTTGKACGDSCISRSYTCHQGSGCACNGY